MQPTYSPDGRYWWDGSQWQPVPGAPEQGAAPPIGPPPWVPPAPTPQRPNRLPLIIGIAVLVLVIISAGVVYLVIRGQTPSANPPPGPVASPTPAGPTLKPGERVTKEKLSQVSAADFLWGSLTRQMTQPVSVITNAYFQTPANFTKHDKYYVKQVGIDHRTGADLTSKDLTAASVTYTQDKPEHLTRCVDEQAHWLSEDYETKKPSWRQSTSTSCRPEDENWNLTMSDGIVPCGLELAQAEVIVKALRDEFAGFVNPQQPTLVTASGRTYIRQVVDYKAIKLEDGRYWGNQIFVFAFKETGLDPQTWPFAVGLGPGEGLHAAYYLDTKTLLPVATIVRSTPVLADDGSIRERYDQTQVINYQFPPRLTPLTLKDTKPIPVLVPEGWKIPE